jgi:hypothetical protein
MIQLRKKDGEWVQFYVLSHAEELDERSLSELADMVYGKYIGGFSGFNPWWVYLQVKKSDLREVE